MRDFTDITILLDRSGSMDLIKTDTIGGFNNFLRGQKEAGENAAISLVQFDKHNGVLYTDRVTDAQPITAAPELTGTTIIPRGWTPLLDAVGSTIEATGIRLAAIPEADRPDKVVFVVITDGHENASTEYTSEMVRRMVSQQEDTYTWQFIYLGANVDEFAEAQQIGIGRGMSAGYSADRAGTKRTYDLAGEKVVKIRGGLTGQSLAFTDEERESLKGGKK